MASTSATIYAYTMVESASAVTFADSTANAVPNNRDLAFDKTTGKFKLVNGNWSFTQGADAIRQGIEIRLQFFLGEWFLDVTKGIAYYQQVFAKNPSVPVVRAMLREKILEAPGVRTVTSLEVALNKSTRKMSVAWTADTDAGEITGVQQRIL